MRTAIVASIFLAVAAPTLSADLIVKQEVENSGQTQQVTLKIKDTKCRIEATDQTSAIIDSATGVTTVLLHPQKAYMKISGEQLRAQAEAMKNLLSGKEGDAAQAEFKPTGKRETINGYETEEYTASVGGIQTTVAVAKNFPNYQEVVKALFNVQSGPGMDIFRNMSIPPEKYPGMPIRTVVEVLGQKITTTVDSVEETSLADSDFTIPIDYKELSPNSLQNKDKSEDNSQ
ncbi:MAG: DUF4412 domain-containing protein [Chthoniobacterales bacterium]